ncbi:hypothetical protein QJQ45_029882 [Haematococcus lacustris]|nr:hypothetical protein QJQ45_029882 [Haematococcus lacustris]
MNSSSNGSPPTRSSSSSGNSQVRRAVFIGGLFQGYAYYQRMRASRRLGVDAKATAPEAPPAVLLLGAGAALETGGASTMGGPAAAGARGLLGLEVREPGVKRRVCCSRVLTSVRLVGRREEEEEAVAAAARAAARSEATAAACLRWTSRV